METGTTLDRAPRPRTHFLALAVPLVLAGCGAGAAPEPEAAATGPAPAAPATDHAAARSEGASTEPVAPPGAPDLGCTGPGECTFARFPNVTTEADCDCRGCGGEAVSLAELSVRWARYQEVCGAWLRAHDCPPTTCREPTERSLCIGGRCLAEPVVGEDHVGPAPCRSPADCPGRAACVTSALGGERGCTNETCCGAAECYNGCADDADCPSCRPHCRGGACLSETGAP